MVTITGSCSTGNHNGELRGMDSVTQAHDARTFYLYAHTNMLMVLFAHTGANDIHTQIWA